MQKKEEPRQLGTNKTREPLLPLELRGLKGRGHREAFGNGKCVLKDHSLHLKGDSVKSCCSHPKKALPCGWYLDGLVGHRVMVYWTQERG